MPQTYTYSYIEFEQPLGTFLLAVVPARDVLKFFAIDRREYDGTEADGTQRLLKKERVKEIAEYCKTLDAAFPSSVLLALLPNQYVQHKKEKTIEITGKAEVIDGQHRIEGLKLAVETYGAGVIEDFQLPCVFIFEPIPEEKAYIFATINGKQTKVNKSIVYDLFGISDSPDPYNVLHTLARTLNFMEDSPFYRRLKMLGKKSDDVETESLSQGTFINAIIDKISKDPLVDRDLIRQGKLEEIKPLKNLVLQDYLLKGKGDLLIPLFVNIFNAVRETWPNEWEMHEDYILSKTTGYIGIMKGIDAIINYGKTNGVLTEEYFKYFFTTLKKKINENHLSLTSEYFPPGGRGENRLKDLMIQVYNESFPISSDLLKKWKS